jgi:hypothetical protein
MGEGKANANPKIRKRTRKASKSRASPPPGRILNETSRDLGFEFSLTAGPRIRENQTGILDCHLSLTGMIHPARELLK